MQVGVDVKCMHINFGGCGLSHFGDIATFKFGQISLLDHGPWSMQVESAQKVMRAQNVSHSSLLVNYGIHFEFVNYGV